MDLIDFFICAVIYIAIYGTLCSWGLHGQIDDYIENICDFEVIGE
jgi:hypothetical protein